MSTPHDPQQPHTHGGPVGPVQPVYMVPQQPYPQNGLAVAGLVLGIVAALVSVAPLGILVVWPAAVLAIVFGVISHSKANQGWCTRKRMAVAGWTLGTVALVVTPIVWGVVFGAMARDAVNEADQCPNTPAVIEPCDVY